MKRKTFIALLMASFLMFQSACTAPVAEESVLPEPESAEESVEESAEESIASEEQLAMDYEEQTAYLISKGRRENRPEEAEGYSGFAMDMTKAWLALGNTQNDVISPYSMYEVLGMLSEATGDALSEEILAELGCSDENELDLQRAKMQEMTGTLGLGENFSSYNSLWLNDGTSFDDDKVASMEERFEAEIYRLDLSKSSSRGKISQWIAEKTKGVFGDGSRPAEEGPADEQEAVLLNALYFKSEYAFPSGIRKIAFTNADGSICNVKGCGLSETLLVYQSERFICARVVIGPESCLTVLLPAEGVEITAEDTEALEFLLGIPEAYELYNANVQIPYFKVGGDAQDSEKLLRKLGLDALFEPGAMEGFIVGDKSTLHIDQAAMTALSSEGVEAPAYTEAVLYAGIPEIKDIDLIIDRPFLFALSLGDCVLTVGSVDQLEESSFIWDWGI